MTKTQIYNVRQIKLKYFDRDAKPNKKDVEILIWTNDGTYDDAQADIKLSLFHYGDDRFKVISDVAVS